MLNVLHQRNFYGFLKSVFYKDIRKKYLFLGFAQAKEVINDKR